MIKINDILKLVNDGLTNHYYKDIETKLVAELVTRQDSEGNDETRPAIYTGNGNYEFIQNDIHGLNIYHRILSFDNDEDLEGGFGRSSLTTENYSIRIVFFGQQVAINESCNDVNLYLAKEFKKLIPRSFDLADTNRISVIGIDYDKEKIKNEEFIDYNPDSVLFTIDMNVIIKGIETCNELSC